jgi:hypothetical protein
VKTGKKDAGARGAVTGGKHADGFVRLIAEIVRDAGLPDISIRTAEKSRKTLPGYFRPTKEWDLVVTTGNDLVAVVEVKSQVGSFGNNFNNRVEEAVGSATDFWFAYRTGIFRPSQKPWLGYLFMLEEREDSLKPKRRLNLEPFAVDEVFQERSYSENYQEVCRRLVRELLYDSACFLTSSEKTGVKGAYVQPDPELGIDKFAISLQARAGAFAKSLRRR